jgi:hypothetical protein
MEKKKKVRNSAKAVIIRDGKLLVILKRIRKDRTPSCRWRSEMG